MTSISSPPTAWPRRRWLQAAGAGLLLAGPGLRMAFAASAQARGKLVVVMLRGALDGLAAVPAMGDPQWTALRPLPKDAKPDATTPLPLHDGFALHPSLVQLHRWYGDGQLLVVHAVASPYRERSHFDAQQLLESGGQRPFELATGWLGRALQVSGQRAVALSPAMPVALRGAPAASTWTPTRAAAPDSDLMARIAQTYQSDPMLSDLLDQALAQRQTLGGGSREPGMGAGAGSAAAFAGLARQAGRFLSDGAGPDVAWLDLDGWDTHTQQASRLQRQLAALDTGLAALRESLGERWADTTVLVMTEFGRSAAFNGSAGTDHGTGGVAFLAGGAVAGGRVLTDWPGLGRRDLLEGRDLRPTRDIRTLLAPLLQRHLGADRATLAKALPGAPAGAIDLWTA
ncbi:DUF1501 domain-containing protein [Hydrogenophaga sp. BPS33]|uniref:DUF1501 domain-containing protein n=1 Tax=Hydrogenophaga sp. BPS33 TaxID=2651974 RepID=UPI0013204CE2|nr:DUF1501 domain-containing protein [Hydrogenophaga sp. BPS33]QHE88428.1 DUF1501 domain-containing protein [Hydrogenophaga sp. BPS33]